MARIKEINTKRPHQLVATRVARKVLNARPGGIILADGVGLGKTYEALATTATLLAQKQHGKTRKRKQAFRVLIVVPPNLVTKWASELENDGFLQYLKGWERKRTTQAVHHTFSREVVVLRRYSDLHKKKGTERYRKHVLPPGCYITNSNLLFRSERKVTQLHNTPWDAVIVDEAHRTAGALLQFPPHALLANPRTKAILLTATPFQLSPGELQCLLGDTFGGYGSPANWAKASECGRAIYENDEFHEYRKGLNNYFRNGDTLGLRQAAKLRSSVSQHMRERMIRSPKRDKRRYFFVDGDGLSTPIQSGLFQLSEEDLAGAMESSRLVLLGDHDVDIYLGVRNRLAQACAKGQKPFVAAALRQLLSSYEQFAVSHFGRQAPLPPKLTHPKLLAVKRLVSTVMDKQLNAGEAKKRGWLEKILVFTTYVGAEHSGDYLPGEKGHGTASTVKQLLETELKQLLGKPGKVVQRKIADALVGTLRTKGKHLTHGRRGEYSGMEKLLKRFAGTPSAGYLLSSESHLRREVKYLSSHLDAIGVRSTASSFEKRKRENDKRGRKLENLRDRYATRDLVARYDGAVDPYYRDQHLRGFNSPYAPLVLIASSIGQEGIDLQRYCSHVVHYDLEWNPARIEQREGRVDRQGREAKGPVNVYFLICKDTYDERVLHVMVSRLRWHQILLADRRRLQVDPGHSDEPVLPSSYLQRVTLDLRPRR